MSWAMRTRTWIEAVREAIDKGTSSSLNCPEEVESGRSALRTAPLGREGALCPHRRRSHGRGRSDRPGLHGPRQGGLLRLSRLARLVSGGQSGDGKCLRRASPFRPGSGRCSESPERARLSPFATINWKNLQSILESNKNEIAAIVMEPHRNEYPIPDF